MIDIDKMKESEVVSAMKQAEAYSWNVGRTPQHDDPWSQGFWTAVGLEVHDRLKHYGDGARFTTWLKEIESGRLARYCMSPKHRDDLIKEFYAIPRT